MSAEIAIIGGTGLTSMAGLSITRREMIKTPYGSPSGPLIFGDLDGGAVVFLARHGHKHSIPPHRINYRANIWALESVGIKRVVAVGAVGGITGCDTGDVVIPDQIIDYTQSRQGTYYDGKPYEVRHVDFSYPYDAKLRATLIDAGKQASVNLIEGGVYGVQCRKLLWPVNWVWLMRVWQLSSILQPAGMLRRSIPQPWRLPYRLVWKRRGSC